MIMTGAGGGTSVLGVGTTRKVLGATDRFMGDPVVAAAGLGGTEAAGVIVRGRDVLDWMSTLVEVAVGVRWS